MHMFTEDQFRTLHEQRARELQDEARSESQARKLRIRRRNRKQNLGDSAAVRVRPRAI